MAAKTYDTGADANQISLDMQVGTAAGWAAEVFKADGAGGFTTIAQSSISGVTTIFNTASLGTAKDLRNGQITIEIRADFSVVAALDPCTFKTDNAALMNALDVTYTLDGGQDGRKSFSFDANDVSFSTDCQIVVVDKNVNFK